MGQQSRRLNTDASLSQKLGNADHGGMPLVSRASVALNLDSVGQPIGHGSSRRSKLNPSTVREEV